MRVTNEDNNVMAGSGPSEVERLTEEVRREHDMYLRALADFDNYRRRVERDNGEAARSAKREIILALLEVLDGFDCAVQQTSEAPSLVAEGLQILHRKLLRLLEAQGVTPFKSVGEAFNPELHEAIALATSDAHESGIVVEEVQRGYRLADDVVRPARVRVAQ